MIKLGFKYEKKNAPKNLSINIEFAFVIPLFLHIIHYPCAIFLKWESLLLCNTLRLLQIPFPVFSLTHTIPDSCLFQMLSQIKQLRKCLANSTRKCESFYMKLNMDGYLFFLMPSYEGLYFPWKIFSS